jgi:hypothetical protein
MRLKFAASFIASAASGCSIIIRSKRFQLTKYLQIIECVRSIRIDHQRQLRKPGSHGSDRLDIPARRILIFTR